jgi:ABC-type oligopeptide transport system substrate-binding subunit
VRRYYVRARSWPMPLHVWLWRLTLLCLVVLGYTLSTDVPVDAAEQPERGGTVVWAVHEGMPHFDIHVEGSYILAQPVGPLYNSLLAFDLYNDQKIVGELAERWEVAPDGQQITFTLRTNRDIISFTLVRMLADCVEASKS